MGIDCPEVLNIPDNLKAFIALGKDDAVSHLFVEKLNPRDVKKVALQNLLRLEESNAAERGYTAINHSLQLSGVCPSCQKTAAPRKKKTN